MKVLIATRNEGKIEKYSNMLDLLNIEYCTLKDFDVDIEINENGKTTSENAKIKAIAYYNGLNMPVLTDDSGLVIDKLPEDKQPGVMVRRYNGKELSDEEIIELYSKEIENVGGESTGAFVISIAIIDKNGNIYIKETKHKRLFVSKPDCNRVPGYPLSSLIYDKETNMYMTEKKAKGIKIYNESSFGEEIKFIQSILGGEDEK